MVWIHSFYSCIQNTTTRCGTKPTIAFTPLYFDNSLHVHTMKVFKQIYQCYLYKWEGIKGILCHMYGNIFFSLDDKIRRERFLRVSIIKFLKGTIWFYCMYCLYRTFCKKICYMGTRWKSYVTKKYLKATVTFLIFCLLSELCG